MFHPHRKALAAGLAAALSLAGTAGAQPIDARSPDARDAAQPARVVVAGPPTWPAHQQPVTRSRAVASASPSGFDWGSAGIGAAAGLGACAIALLGIGGLRRRMARPAAGL